MKFRKTKAQSVTEYAILLGVAIAVFAGMQLYVKRGLNARVKKATDAATMSGGGINVNLADGLFDADDLTGISRVTKDDQGNIASVTALSASADYTGDGAGGFGMSLGNQAQYEAYYTESKANTYSENVQRERLANGKIQSEIVSQVSGQSAGSYSAQRKYNATISDEGGWAEVK